MENGVEDRDGSDDIKSVFTNLKTHEKPCVERRDSVQLTKTRKERPRSFTTPEPHSFDEIFLDNSASQDDGFIPQHFRHTSDIPRKQRSKRIQMGAKKKSLSRKDKHLIKQLAQVSEQPTPLLQLSPVLEGQLLVKSDPKNFRKNKKWVILDAHSLYLFQSAHDVAEPRHTIPLLGSAVKTVESGFSVLTPTTTFQFYAANDEEKMKWVMKIQEISERQTRDRIGATTQVQRGNSLSVHPHLQSLLSENSICADCGASHPLWVSLNLGVFVCIACSGVHRKLGVHISQIRSVELDKWDDKMLATLDGAISRREEHIPPGQDGIHEFSTDEEREAFIRAKYAGKEKVASKGLASPRRSLNKLTDKELKKAKNSSSIDKMTSPRRSHSKLNDKELKEAILRLLKTDNSFRSEVRALLLQPSAS